MTLTGAPRPRLALVRPFTTHVVNPISRRLAGHLPGFAILTYRGRTSGRTLRTPMNVFRDRPPGGYVFALTYGSDVDWVRNVLAAGTCEMDTRGRHVTLVAPELFVDRARRPMPMVVRQFLGLLRVSEFLRMRDATTAASAVSAGGTTLRPR